MRSIYKYTITNSNGTIIEGPITKLLTAQEQHGEIVVWAEVDTDKPNVKYQVVAVGTGWPLDPLPGKECMLDTFTYLNTVQFIGGALILHVYAAEILPAPVKNREDANKKGTIDAEMRKAADKVRKESYTVTTVINPEILAHFIR
jgi:hypothetical protein